MSLYNMVNGVNPCAFFILPFLDMHPDTIPRFRDCFLSDEEHPDYNNHIHIYTRVGGNNRGEGYGEEKLMQHELFVTTFDDSFDNTFGTYVFKVPKEYQKDFDQFLKEGPKKFSKAAQSQCRKVYPKLNKTYDELWNEKQG